MHGIGGHMRTLFVDLTLIIFGLAAVFAAKALPKTRPEKRARKAKAEETPLEESLPVPAE